MPLKRQQQCYNLNSVTTGGEDVECDTSGVGGAGGVGVNINASANSATTVTSTVAIYSWSRW
ncbi:hypothetical protein AWE47_01830 [Piscirickettsia salmonis]|nr:hypothetical protein AWE47_01830 [Piscirickettsia salmonis]